MSRNILDTNYVDEMEESYLDYAMSVIVSRALPDVRDGLKPVQRRVLYAMGDLGLSPNKPHKKSARVVGDVLGKYHPHGDSSVYEAMVRLAQDFSTRYPLVDGHGNFGSIDGDNAAAMRYTEVRLTEMGQAMLKDINKNTVNFKKNFDESLEEPEVLPTLIPYSLLCGISGIAVGMATNMAPYNIVSVYNALEHIIDSKLKNRDVTEDEIFEIIGLPDFPTGGVIVNYTEAREAVISGRGRVVVRAKHEIETSSKGERIIITEIPYQVNKTNLIKKMKEVQEELKDIREIRDESTKDIRIVVDLKKNAQTNLILNTLFKKTQLQSTFSINNTVLINGIPQEVGIHGLLESFLDHSKEVVTNRTKHDLDNSSSEAHLKEGVLIALDNIDQVIEIIKDSEDNKESMERLMEELNLSERQSRSIQSTQLGNLSRSSRKKIEEELEKLNKAIKIYEAILSNEEILYKVIKEEYKFLKEKLGDDRRTSVDKNSDPNIDIDDLIEDETLIITYTQDDLIKSIAEKEFKSQNRGGKGSKGFSMSNEDVVESLYTLNSKDDLLFITNKGICHKLKAYDIEKSKRSTQGRYIGNYLDLEEDEKVLRLIALNLEERKDDYLIMLTRFGTVKKIKVSDLGVRSARVITFRDDDYLVDCYPINEETEKLMITSDKGMSIKIDPTKIRASGRTSMGVKGIELNEGDYVNSLLILEEDSNVLTISEKGLGKMTSSEEFNIQNRGGKGVRYYKLTEKTGAIVDSISIKRSDEVLVMTEKGLSIRLKAEDLPLIGRSTSGSRMINLADDDKVNSITAIIPEEDDDEESED